MCYTKCIFETGFKIAYDAAYIERERLADS